MPRKANRAPFYSQVAQSWCIPLSNAVIALVDEDIANSLGWLAWSATSCESQWRAIRATYSDKKYTFHYMHRVIANPAPGYDVDHRIHPPHEERLIDNRRANLRVCEHVLNQRSLRMAKSNTSGFKGVTWRADTRRWAAAVMLNYKHVSLGSYSCPIEAAKAYDQGAILHFGEFAITNKSLGLLT